MTVKELSAPKDRIEGLGDRTRVGDSTGVGVRTRGGFTLENVFFAYSDISNSLPSKNTEGRYHR